MLVKVLESLLERAGGFDLLPAASTIAGLTELAGKVQPDIVLMDLTPDVTFQALGALRRAAPESKLVLWVNTISTELACHCMGLGIHGILRRTLPIELQLRCLSRVAAGEFWFEKALTDPIFGQQPAALTPREDQLVALLAQGMKNKEMGAAMGISESAVKAYLSRVFQKVGVKDRFELALYGLKRQTAGPALAAANGRVPGRFLPGLRALGRKPVRPAGDAVFRAASVSGTV
jgi:DNA-binding NarL/FixJ family response regulator